MDLENALIATDFKYVDFGDARLVERFSKIIKQIASKPSASIPESFDSWGQTKAVYRFFSNQEVKPEIIVEGMGKSTVNKIRTEKLILCPTDTTSFSFKERKKTSGLCKLNHNTNGFLMHSTLAVTERGTPIGLIGCKFWAHEKKDENRNIQKLPIAEKESVRWLESLQELENKIPKNVKAIMIGDKECDIYDTFAAKKADNVNLLVRIAHNRKINDGNEKLFGYLEKAPLAGKMIVKIGKTQDGSLREAELELRYKKFSLPAPREGVRKIKKKLTLWAIEVKEVNAPETIEKPVLWRLVTTMEIKSLANAFKYVDYYAKRWLIERFHFTLKSGCNVEKLQLRSRERLSAAIATYSVVACRLLNMTYLARVNPSARSDVILEEDEWKALCCFSSKKSIPPQKPPPLTKAIWLIAKLGGFLGRKSDGNPGVKVLWKGITRLSDITETYNIFKRGPNVVDTG